MRGVFEVTLDVRNPTKMEGVVISGTYRRRTARIALKGMGLVGGSPLEGRVRL